MYLFMVVNIRVAKAKIFITQYILFNLNWQSHIVHKKNNMRDLVRHCKLIHICIFNLLKRMKNIRWNSLRDLINIVQTTTLFFTP